MNNENQYEQDSDYGAPEPKFMATETYAESHADTVTAYAKMRVHGIHPSVAFRRVFGEDHWDTFGQARIYAVESTEVYNNAFRKILLETPVKELWNEKLAIHKLLAIANNVFEKGSTQFRAIQELNILIGIVVTDENGKTRKGGKMSDFYDDVGTEHLRGKVGAQQE